MVATNSFRSFCSAIFHTCEKLSDVERIEFFEKLAQMFILINGDNLLVKSSLKFKLLVMALLSPSTVEPVNRNPQSFRDGLKALENRVRVESDIIDNLDSEEKAPRLLLLFILDMLPRSAASIVRSKADRDRLPPVSLSTSMSVVYWMVVLAVNAGSLGCFLFMLFAYPASHSMQLLWLNCVLFWIALDALLVNALYVSFTHLLLPAWLHGAYPKQSCSSTRP